MNIIERLKKSPPERPSTIYCDWLGVKSDERIMELRQMLFDTGFRPRIEYSPEKWHMQEAWDLDD